MSKTESAAKHTMFCRLKRVELSIVGVLWDAGEGQTVREVFEELYSHGPWSYNTVRTTMTSLAKSNLLKQGRRGRSNVFVPTISREEAAAACVQAVITEILGGKLSDDVVTVLKNLPLTAAGRRAVRAAL